MPEVTYICDSFSTVYMDSLTQIVLGAACGEAILGKKIGNKALLFGAIAGTIPDLDVFVGNWLFSNEIDVTMFHRGFMHSIVFAVLGAFAFGWLTFWLYNRGSRTGSTNRNDWILMFFLALFTHPLLDCFTPYGTQLFLPFSDYRVAFDTISVVDPLYTLPFLMAMIALMFFSRKNTKRQLWLKIGLGISSLYLLLTVINKLNITQIFKNSFDKANIKYTRFRTQPSIFNNVLWYGIAETETDYMVGYYSLFDQHRNVSDMMRIPKQHDLANLSHPDLERLSWFSDGYFRLESTSSQDTLRYKDLRYPLLNPKDENSSVFNFKLFQTGERWDIRQDFDRTPTSKDFEAFWQRLKGN